MAFIILFIVMFLILFWVFSVKLPKIGEGIVNVGNSCYHSVMDKKHFTKEGDEVNLIGLISFNCKRFGRWVKKIFSRKKA